MPKRGRPKRPSSLFNDDNEYKDFRLFQDSDFEQEATPLPTNNNNNGHREPIEETRSKRTKLSHMETRNHSPVVSQSNNNIVYTSSQKKILRNIMMVRDKAINSGEMCKDVTELLQLYPQWCIDSEGQVDEVIWKDLIKKSKPIGFRRKGPYNLTALRPLIEKELEHLLKVRNTIKHIITHVTARSNKRLILDMTATMMGEDTYQTGGGTSQKVRRIETIYYQEGNIPQVKRTATTRM